MTIRAPTTKNIEKRLQDLGDPKDAAFLQRYFKTGAGEYGAGDTFLGIRVPALRAVAKEFRAVSIDEAFVLLRSPFHEARLAALFILVEHFRKGDAAARKRIYDGYLARTRYVNNWDLVDSSAPTIVGGFLAGRSKAPLTKLAKSKLVWERRIAMLATLAFIRTGEYAETLRLATLLLHDEHDLIHKAVGWMLREVGQKDRRVLEHFIDAHAAEMPRTMLRYAIEKLPPGRRKYYLSLRAGSTLSRRGGAERRPTV